MKSLLRMRQKRIKQCLTVLMGSLLALLLTLNLPHPAGFSQVAVASDAAETPSSPAATASPKENAVTEQPANRVVLDGKELFAINTSASGKSRTDRAKELSDRLKTLADQRSLPVESIDVKDNPINGTTEIVAGDEVIFAVTNADAQVVDQPRKELAYDYRETIRSAIANYRDTYSPEKLLWGIGKAAIATIVLLALLFILNRIYRLVCGRVNALYGNRIRTIRLGSRDLVQAEQISRFLLRTVNLLRMAAVLGLLFLYFNTVLSFFPQTAGISSTISGSLFSAFNQVFQSIVAYIPKLIFLIVLSAITFYLLKFVRFILNEIDKGDIVVPGFDRDWAMPTSRIALVVIFTFYVVIAFPYLPGAGSEAFQGISIFLGILLSLGSSSAISNVIAGIMLTYTRAFRIGDDVQIADVSGTVIEKGLLVTRLCTFNNQFVSIPNAEVLSKNVINFRASGQLPGEDYPPPSVSLEVAIGQEVPWAKAYEILLDSAKAVSDQFTDQPPEVRHHAFKGGQVIYELEVFPKRIEENGDILRAELLQRIHDRCEREDIRLDSPNYLAWWDEKPSATGLVAASRKPEVGVNGVVEDDRFSQ